MFNIARLEVCEVSLVLGAPHPFSGPSLPGVLEVPALLLLLSQLPPVFSH